MSSILLHFDQHKFLYKNQTNFQHLKIYLKDDINEYLSHVHVNNDHHQCNQLHQGFQLVYIDEDNGDWMLVQSQLDLDHIISIKKNKKILMKILPSRQQENCSNKINKLFLSKQLQEMGQFICKKYSQKFILNSAIQEYLQQTYLDVQNQVQESMYKTQQIKRVSRNRHSILDSRNTILQKQKKHRKIDRISPFKNRKADLQQKIQQKLKERLKSLVPEIYSIVLSKTKKNMCQCSKYSGNLNQSKEYENPENIDLLL